MDNMFELVLANEKEIVLKVIAKGNLENLDKNSYLDANYITVTRGIDHVLEVIKDDMSIFSFSWGFNGHTVISDKFERLKKEVIEFLISKEIFINFTNDEIVKKTVYFDKCFNQWACRIENAKGQVCVYMLKKS